MTDTPINLDEIEARANKAAEGPWEKREFAHDKTPLNERCVYRMEIFRSLISHGKRFGSRLICSFIDFGNHTDDEATVEFITHARTDIPALTAAVRARDAEIECLRAQASAGVGDGEAMAALTDRAALSVARMIEEWHPKGLNAEGMADLVKLISRRLKRFFKPITNPVSDAMVEEDITYLKAIARDGYVDWTRDTKALSVCKKLEKLDFCRISFDGPDCWRVFQSSDQVKKTTAALTRQPPEKE